MSREQIFNVFKELIYEHSYVVSRDVEINMDSRVVADLNIDSLDRVNIVIAAEKAFDIELDDDEIATFPTIEDFVNLIEKKCNAKK
jgi:acyl carrier protein